VTFSSVLHSSLPPSSPFASPFSWAWHPTYSTCFGSSKARSSAHWVPYSCTGYPVHDSDFSRCLDCCHLGPSHQSSTSILWIFSQLLTPLYCSFGGSSRPGHLPEFRDRTLDRHHLTRLFGATLLIQSLARYYPSLNFFSSPTLQLRGPSSMFPFFLPRSLPVVEDTIDVRTYVTLFSLFDAFTTFPSRHHTPLDFALFLPAHHWGLLSLTSSSIGATHLQFSSVYAFKPPFEITPPTIHSGLPPVTSLVG
jgi:hypothetical protein